MNGMLIPNFKGEICADSYTGSRKKSEAATGCTASISLRHWKSTTRHGRARRSSFIFFGFPLWIVQPLLITKIIGQGLRCIELDDSCIQCMTWQHSKQGAVGYFTHWQSKKQMVSHLKWMMTSRSRSKRPSWISSRWLRQPLTMLLATAVYELRCACHIMLRIAYRQRTGAV